MPTAVAIDSLVKDIKQKLVLPQSPDSILDSLSLQEKVFLLSGTSFTRSSGLERHGLHPVKTSDAATDVRGDTVFSTADSLVLPNATCVASSWDVELVEQAGAVMGGEAKWKEVDVLLAPTLNLHRDPRGGRNQESYGEDGVLAGHMGSAFAKGVQSRGVLVCLKHLVCNDSETDRRTYDSIVDEQVLRDIYMRPFEIAVEGANPASIMTSYNRINGTSGASNKHVMDIVREEWGWDGVYMSDWFGTYDGVSSVKAGCDLEMPFPAARGPKLLQALAQGKIDPSELDPLCLRMIRFLQRANAPRPDARRPDRPSPQHPHDISIARRVAAEGSVLLQNNGILPLDPSSTETVAVIGAHATAATLSHLIMPSYTVSPLDGIKAVLGERLRYSHGPHVYRTPPMLDARFSSDIEFRFWNKGDRGIDKAPALVRQRTHALEALLMTRIPGLGDNYEIEMSCTVTVPVTGTYIVSLTATAESEITLDGKSIYSYHPGGVVDVQQFLFYSHDFIHTVKVDLDAGRQYTLGVVTQKQAQVGHEPVGQGLVVGMVQDQAREDLVAAALDVARTADKVVLCVGTTSEWEMEGIDRDDIDLPCGQADFVREVLKVNRNVIIVNQSGAAVDLTCAAGAAAVVHAHFGGQEAGNAIADVLFGKVNPSGRATYTWPRQIEDCPTYGHFPRSDNLELRYAEGMAMGYRGFKKSAAAPLYSFGHGGSYTTFEWSDPVIRRLDNSRAIAVTLSVKNTGARAGREVVQVYVQRADQPAWQASLEGFTKTRELQPGQAEIVEITVTERAFVKWSEEQGRHVESAGTHKLYISRSAEDCVFEVEHK